MLKVPVGMDGVEIVTVFDDIVAVVLMDGMLVVDKVGGFFVDSRFVVVVVGGLVVVPPGFIVVVGDFVAVAPGFAVDFPGSAVVSAGMVVSVSDPVPVSSAGASPVLAAQPQPERTKPANRSTNTSSTAVNE